MKPIRIVSTAASLAALAVSASAQFYTLGAGSTAYDVSGDGSRVVGYNGNGNFVWSAGTGLQGIGGNAPGNGFGGRPAISDDGTTLVASATNAQGLNEMSRYSFATGQWTALGNLGASSGDETSSGWNLSADGSTAVGLGWIDGGTAHGIVSRSGVVTDLGSTVAGASTRANAVSGDGGVIVGWQDAEDGFRQGAVWKDGVQTILKDGQGNVLGEADVVSNDGVWVAGNGNYAADGELWRWSEATGYQALGSKLDASDFSTGFTGMNGDATAMVGYSRGFGPARLGKGVLWTSSLGVMDLNEYVASQGIDTQGVTLALPLGMSADGQTIVGLGSNGQGWVVRLPNPVPEPGTMAALALGTATLLRRRKRA